MSFFLAYDSSVPPALYLFSGWFREEYQRECFTEPALSPKAPSCALCRQHEVLVRQYELVRADDVHVTFTQLDAAQVHGSQLAGSDIAVGRFSCVQMHATAILLAGHFPESRQTTSEHSRERKW